MQDPIVGFKPRLVYEAQASFLFLFKVYEPQPKYILQDAMAITKTFNIESRDCVLWSIALRKARN